VSYDAYTNIPLTSSTAREWTDSDTRGVQGGYDGAVAAGDPTLQRTKFYVNHYNME